MPQAPALGLVRYDAMVIAIAECHQVDEVKDLRDKAKALEVYAKQARNLDAEHKAAEVRIRAERRCGQLLAEMKTAGRMDRGAIGNAGPGRGHKAPENAVEKRDLVSETKLVDLGITKDQSSYQEPGGRMEKFLTGGGRSLEAVCAPEHWDCHEWGNCPTHAAYGASGINGVPEPFRVEAAIFIGLFDARLLQNPLEARTAKAEEGVA